MSEEITIEKLYDAMPEDFKKKVSHYDLKRIVEKLSEKKPLIYTEELSANRFTREGWTIKGCGTVKKKKPVWFNGKRCFYKSRSTRK